MLPLRPLQVWVELSPAELANNVLLDGREGASHKPATYRIPHDTKDSPDHCCPPFGTGSILAQMVFGASSKYFARFGHSQNFRLNVGL